MMRGLERPYDDQGNRALVRGTGLGGDRAVPPRSAAARKVTTRKGRSQGPPAPKRGQPNSPIELGRHRRCDARADRPAVRRWQPYRCRRSWTRRRTECRLERKASRGASCRQFRRRLDWQDLPVQPRNQPKSPEARCDLGTAVTLAVWRQGSLFFRWRTRRPIETRSRPRERSRHAPRHSRLRGSARAGSRRAPGARARPGCRVR